MNHVDLITKVRNYYKEYENNYDTLQSIFLAYKTIVQRNIQSPLPKRDLNMEFYCKTECVGFYWSLDDDETGPKSRLEISVLTSIDGNFENIYKKYIDIHEKSSFAILFELTVFIQDNHNYLMKAMNLEQIFYSIFNENDDIVVRFAEHFHHKTSKYIPMQ